ncbi:thiol-disulfide oxidoreductase DCC family protein [Pedobacter antarcticus]|uniref:thiol-disulfide oxidoreductase DCC family protein n=1 Tax=Pedobacter antarcticus TaxID=34086 RepID=UPI001C5A2A88|nr:thiol-disulfide oxidoreductase DCC family protein [Pedobacter antarcticus]
MEGQIVFFDGVCNLCTGTVKFIISRDKQDKFRFAALQSESAKTILKDFNINPENSGTILLLKEGKVYQKSAAALEIAAGLGGGWPVFKIFKLVPTFIRDFVYGKIASNRYRIWGKQESCMVPTPELKAKFL